MGNAQRTEPPARSPAEDFWAAARFAIPDLMRFHVSRPRLLELLARADSRPLVVVSAPAGTGKTSLVAEWVKNTGETDLTGWITFESGDTAFWGFLVECLRRLGLEVPTPDPAPEASLERPDLTGLAAAVAGTRRRVTVVLDGPEIGSLRLAQEVDSLLRHTFGRLRLVSVGRVDPLLPLYRYRLTDSLLEVRAADLAFTDAEASQLLSRSGVALSRAAVHDLNQRTRGWAAGLRFAGLTLSGRESPERSVTTVVAQTSDINEYLIGEVLEVQTPEVRQVLLDTCVPDVLCPGLAEELGGSDAGRILRQLSRSNTFIESIPGQPGFYRYYPFFRDLLRARSHYESPQRMVDLHRSAARWFRREGLPAQSIGQLATIGAWGEAAGQLVADLLVGRLVLEGEQGPLYPVAARIPGHLDLPAAWAVRAAVALATGDRAGCAEALSRCRPAVQADGRRDTATLVCVSVLDAVRASLADDVESAIRTADAAERLLSGWRGTSGAGLHLLARFSQGVAKLRRGDLGGARKAFTSVVGSEPARRYPAFRADCLGYLALIEAVKGHLSRARRIVGESENVASSARVPETVRSSAASVAQAWVALEQYDLKTARECVASAMASESFVGNPISQGLAEGVMAGVERASGRLESALARLHAATVNADGSDPWLANRLRLESARLNVASGRTETALAALGAIEPRDDPEVAAVAAAAYAEQGQQAAADNSLAQVRTGEPALPARVAGLLVEAVQESRRRAPDRMRVVLNRSLRLAAPEALRRPFFEASPAVQRLLSADSGLLGENRWLNHPARATAPPGQGQRDRQRRNHGEAEVVEALTGKEREVLGYLEELLTTEEIAARMFVSVNTVRTHVRSILRKLAVTRRNAAVRKARQLGLVNGQTRALRTG